MRQFVGSALASPNPPCIGKEEPSGASAFAPNGEGATGRLICPSGCVRDFVSSPAAKKNPLCPLLKSAIELPSSHPDRGAYRDRHGRRSGMRWTRQRRRANGIAGRVLSNL